MMRLGYKLEDKLAWWKFACIVVNGRGESDRKVRQWRGGRFTYLK